MSTSPDSLRWLPARLRARIFGRTGGDAGFSLAEILVALFLITGAVTAMLGMVTRSVQTHRAQRDSAAAERLATTQIESARNLGYAGLASLAALPSVPQPTATGSGFTPNVTYRQCSATDPLTSCTQPSSAATPGDIHVMVDEQWIEGGQVKHFDLTTGVTSSATNDLAGSGSTTISSLTGAATSGLSVSVSKLSLSPSSTTVTTSGHPVQAITVTAALVGLTATTSFPVTWTDDTGSHQATMTNTPGQTTWTATIPASSITRSLAQGTTGSIVFAATVPGAQGVPTTTLSLSPPLPPTITCASPVAITLVLLQAKALLPVPLTCTTTSLASTDTVAVSWPTASGTATGRLASSDGNSWSLTLPANTPLKSAVTETFSFTATRAADNVSAATTTTSVLA
jgi:Tfp pilus assembly protein PilV